MRWLISVALVSSCFAADLAAIREERDPTRRYVLALEHAAAHVAEARTAFQEGKPEAASLAIEQVIAGVRLCDETLRATGKNPSKNPRHFKRAELKMRDIDKRLKTIEEEVGFEERAPIKKVRAEIAKMHEEMLLDIMGRRK
jgi:hypothetical protein